MRIDIGLHGKHNGVKTQGTVGIKIMGSLGIVSNWEKAKERNKNPPYQIDPGCRWASES